MLMAVTFTAAVAVVIIAVVIGGAIGAPRVGTISRVNGPLVARVDSQLVDIYTNLYGDDGRAAGTGMVLTATGEVLTNNHVIQGATSIQAIDVGNGETYLARVIGYDERDDIAILQLDGAAGLPTVELGDSTSAGLGERIITIGNAGGVGGTPAARSGTIIGLNQAITVGDDIDQSTEHLNRLIEVDGDLQPGDSGGPMVDGAGAVVGMDTAASTNFEFTNRPSGEGFAIAIDTVKPIAARISAEHGSSSVHIGPTAFIGVKVQSLGGNPPGADVAAIVPQTPAASVGLGSGDIITSLGGVPVRSSTDLTEALVRYSPGSVVALEWVDPAGVSHTATIVLGTGPAA
jgi:S1-C subfamily serine protease